MKVVVRKRDIVKKNVHKGIIVSMVFESNVQKVNMAQRLDYPQVNVMVIVIQGIIAIQHRHLNDNMNAIIHLSIAQKVHLHQLKLV